MITKEQEKSLILKAFEMKEKAYCPYSKYHVGAAILGESGKIYGGCNIENSSYGASVCGERTAVFKGVSEGERKFLAIAVCCGLEGKEQKIEKEEDMPFPCGICRQVLREFSSPRDFKVYMCATEDQFYIKTLEEIFISE